MQKLCKKWARIMPIYKIWPTFLTWQAKKMKPHKIAGLMRLPSNKEAPDAGD